MGTKTVTTREYVCDNCGEGDVFDNDSVAGHAGWALVTINGTPFALCPQHYEELKDFLMVESFAVPGQHHMLRQETGSNSYTPPEIGATIKTSMQRLGEAFKGRETER